MIKKTLGGQRLGSGNKLEVNLHGYERSTHNMSYIWRSTLSAGTLVPFLCEVALPSDTFDIDLDCDIKTHPTIGPLFGSYKVQLDIFEAPIRLYNSLLHNNMLGIGNDMSKVKLPKFTLTAKAWQPNNKADINNYQINSSCLLNYLGVKGIGFVSENLGDRDRDFNAIPLLAYWEIYKNYYSNKQEGIGAVIHKGTEIVGDITSMEVIIDGGTPQNIQPSPNDTQPTMYTTNTQFYVWYNSKPNEDTIIVNLYGYGNLLLTQVCTSIVNDPSNNRLVCTYNYGQWGDTSVRWYRFVVGSDNVETDIKVSTFDLDNIDTMRKNILAYSNQNSPFNVNAQNLIPYSWVTSNDDLAPRLNSQEGLGVKTYQSDLFNNWLDTTWITNVNQASAVSTAGNSFTIDQLNLSKKVYELLNRIAVSGGTYDDWLDAVYDNNRLQRADSPIYHGGLIKELAFQEVVSNTETEGQPLGTLAGKGVMTNKNKGGKIVIRVNEPSYIIGIISLTPRIDYSQGNRWDVHLDTLDDLHKPQLDEIGFQDLITEQMAYWDTHYVNNAWVQKSAGKQPAWLNYMTNYNRTYGNFAIASNEMFMTLNRRYEHDESYSIKDLTSYIDPAKYNFIFAQTSLDSQNFWGQISVDMIVRRKMSAKIMPNL